jgi:hypothetical protein
MQRQRRGQAGADRQRQGRKKLNEAGVGQKKQVHCTGVFGRISFVWIPLHWQTFT